MLLCSKNTAHFKYYILIHTLLLNSFVIISLMISTIQWIDSWNGSIV